MINLQKIENISLIALTVAVLSVPFYLLVQYQRKTAVNYCGKAVYVGSGGCVKCHIQEYNAWLQSHHAKAMNNANDSLVLGNFNDRIVKYNNITHKLYKRGDKFYAYTDGEDGKLKEFEIKYVFGFYPLQQYLVEFSGGRLQTLPLTWDSKNNKWYHMAAVNYPTEIIEHTNWLHWTNQSQNWNSMCADCHSTNLAKGYNIETNTYNTTFSEINVACEACHGPASLHLKWAKNTQSSHIKDNYGLIIKTSNINNEEYVNLCMRCHSRRTVISDFKHDTDIYNHSIPELPHGKNYYIDGQILEEDYVFASFTQSKMFMQNVKCNNCHNVHSTRLLYNGNRLCTQCHRADDYDTYRHHFHKSKDEKGAAVVTKDGVEFGVGEGTRCINCHATARFYMGVDYRNDHSFRIPRPDLSDKLNIPNACNNCHANKSTKWAVKHIDKWHGVAKHLQYGEVFKEAENSDKKAFAKLVNIYKDEVYPPITRATAIKLLGQYYQKNSKSILHEAMENTNNHIKYNALKNLVIDDAESFNKVLQLVDDNTKAMRIECANKLLGINQSQIPHKYAKALQVAKNEYFEHLKYNADFPSGKFNIANYYYNTNQFEKAEEFYLKTLEQDEELHSVKINLAYLYNSTGEYEKAEALFKDYLQRIPNDGYIMFTYALFLSERQRYKESKQYMLDAAELLPQNARILFNIAMMYDFENNFVKAQVFLKKAIDIDKNNKKYKVALKKLYGKYSK